MIDYVPAQPRRRRRRARTLAGSSSHLARLDWVLLATTLGLVGYGLWAIAGITRHDVPGNPDYYLVRQLVAMAVGLVAMAAMSFVDVEWLRRARGLIYAATLGLMLVVFAVGVVARGSRRWIDIGFYRFQPSEFGKLGLILFLAGFLAERARRGGAGLGGAFAAIAFAVVPTVLVFAQPDLGSALVYIAALLACLFLAGVRWGHLAVIVAAGALVLTAVVWGVPALTGHRVLHEYQVKRLDFLDQGTDPQGVNYNQRQAMVAVGNGGAIGRGVTGATQTARDFLPEHETDFAFASLAEQRGFLGAVVLLLLYLLVVWRGLRAVTLSSDPFGAIVAGAIVFAFVFQVFVNVGMNLGIAPVTGITLPFVSVGGSSLVANLIAIGVLQSVIARGRGRRW